MIPVPSLRISQEFFQLLGAEGRLDSKITLLFLKRNKKLLN